MSVRTGVAGSWNVGQIKITRIVEMELRRGNQFILPAASKDVVKGVKWLQPHFATPEGRLILSIHMLVVETPSGERIAVDTCVGNDKTDRLIPDWNNRKDPFLNYLTEAGFPPESFTHVLCTHLHVDHVGWNTRKVDGKWVPTFSNAKYIFARREYEHWEREAEEDAMTTPTIMNDSVRPVVDAGLVELVETDHVLVDDGLSAHIRLMPTHGHTPGHVSVLVSSEGKDAMITGDWIHHPIQMARLGISAITADSDVVQARNTRIRTLDSLAGSDILVFGTHFATPSCGYVKRDDGAFRFEVLEKATSKL